MHFLNTRDPQPEIRRPLHLCSHTLPGVSLHVSGIYEPKGRTCVVVPTRFYDTVLHDIYVVVVKYCPEAELDLYCTTQRRVTFL